MNIFQALILGLVQGATEFIPISSSAHLVLLPYLLGWDNPSLSFNIMVHFGTILAVIFLFWKEIGMLIQGFFRLVFGGRRDDHMGQLALFLLLATLPAVIIGISAKRFFEDLFNNPLSVSYLLLATGLLMYLSERWATQTKDLMRLSWIDSLIIGVGQALAIAPGISRSGATISFALLRGVKRNDAARFSFLLAIPIIVGTALYEGRDLFLKAESFSLTLPLIVGIVSAFVSGAISIRILLKVVRKRPLSIFSYYCWAVGLISIISKV
ncbi:undecaprenyl-diphosphatase UppP [Candidatus Hakubella thermalkaliphila]|uniref:Undecaprenyl-diphosphatase n=2 Tax=Candidatus Hakubella thermalkaliphila TaxID=2754717 RepID=A0A6V8P5S1_9ACTN|nr:undecaprenyl-diphosphatase UppP [Candidatus Hakubella thermalkaliphila]GFP26954.1 undecaprenyl-diphosphatase [Candidatus Hakubella thermalkaliphila]